jgi:hypothetical protein
MQQEVGFVRVGGSRWAYATSGTGPPLVFPPASFGHLALRYDRSDDLDEDDRDAGNAGNASATG